MIENNEQRRQILDTDEKYGTGWRISVNEGKYGTTWGILDREGRYSIETAPYWIEIGNMRQRREIRVGDEK